MGKGKIYIIGFLAFCVLSSKNIIIYNEETLVALSFLSFVYFIFHSYSNTIKESLNERADGIKLELQNLGLGRLDSLDQLFKEHNKVSELHSKVSGVDQFTKKKLLGTTEQGSTILSAFLSQQIEEKIKALSTTKSNTQQKLQQMIATDVLGLVLADYLDEDRDEDYSNFLHQA